MKDLTMAGADIVECLSLLQLNLLGDEWMQQVWDNDFMEVDELPNEYEEFIMENNILRILENIIQALRYETDASKEDSPVSWELLVENKVQHKHLISLLSYFIFNGQDNPGDLKSLELCFKSCSIYFLLLALPGCDAFFVFHPTIYEKSLKTFNIVHKLNESTKPKKHSKGRRKDNEDDVQDEVCGENDENEANDVSFMSLNIQDKNLIRKLLNVVLNDQLRMIQRYPLKVEDTLEKTISQLVSHTRIIISSSVTEFNVLKVNGEASSFACNSFSLLKFLCSPLHGKIEETIRLIFYHLLPNILMAGDFVKDMTMHNLNMIRIQTQKFILYLLKTLGKDSHKSICVLVQHLCARVTDKADYRLKVSQSIVSLLESLPSEPHFLTIKWLLRFAHDEKASHRLFALEVISKLLYEDERPDDHQERRESIASQNNVSPCEVNTAEDEFVGDDVIASNENCSQSSERDGMSHKYLLGVLFSRCHDQSSTVRTKAISALADCIQTSHKYIVDLMKEVFVTPYEDNDLIEDDTIVERGFLNSKIFLDSLNKSRHLQVDPLPGGKAVIIEMLKFVEDDKVYVRKAAFTFLECVIRLNSKWMTDKLLKAMCNHVRDPALLVKKQLIQSLTDLVLLYPENERLATHYIDAVLPEISHPEMKVQEKVLEVLHSSILQQLVPFKNLSSSSSVLPWKLLKIIIDLKKRKFFQIVCSHWSKNNEFPRNLVSVIQTYIDTEHDVTAWFLLSCVAPYVTIKSPNFIMEYYRMNFSNPEKTARYSVVKALDVLGFAWKHLPKDEQDAVCAELLESVENMHLSITLIGPVLDVVHLITMGQASSAKDGQEGVLIWSERILEKVEDYFHNNAPSKTERVLVKKEEFMRNLVTLGDMAQLCPGRVPEKIAIILTSLFFPEKLFEPEAWADTHLQALTVITLGKICLQNECLAKRIVPALGVVLTESKHEAVRVNIMNTLSDMCIRFTSIVEPLLPEMCVCLKDSNVIVRHHTIAVFVRLLQQDFLKLRGSLLFHMISMLVDPEPQITQLANYFLTHCVVTRYKSLMYQNIVESIFYYNRYESHPVYSKVKLSAQESHLFNMSGAENETKRHTLYRFMCEYMSDEQRMQAIHKICVDILGGVSNDTVSLDEKGENVLRDAFFVLSCEEICLHSLRAQTEEEPATDDGERISSAVNTARKNIISQCVKKQVVEIIVPIIMQLKGKLQSVMSPLLTNLMGYLRNILKDYKNEVEEIFSEDKTLAEEILYDMKRFEEEERNRAQSQESDDEGGGEVDHMHPLLVEIATSHLQKSIRNINPQSNPLNESLGSPDEQPDAALSESRKSISKSPASNTTGDQESSSKANNSQGVSPEQNSQEPTQIPRPQTPSSALENMEVDRGVRTRSCTPTGQSTTQKRHFEDECDENVPPDVLPRHRNTRGHGTPRRSRRAVRSPVSPEFHSSSHTDIADERNETETLTTPSRIPNTAEETSEIDSESTPSCSSSGAQRAAESGGNEFNNVNGTTSVSAENNDSGSDSSHVEKSYKKARLRKVKVEKTAHVDKSGERKEERTGIRKSKRKN